MSPQTAPPKKATTSEPKSGLETETASLEADLHEAIATLARHRWEEDGCPTGQDLDYWLAAEREVLSRTA